MLNHTFPPVYDENSRVLILGSFPSVKSRETGFYYGNAQNRFWRVLAALYSLPVPQSTDEKRQMLLSCGVALWDVIARCDISGSSDASIKNAEANDIGKILSICPIHAVFANGQTAKRLYDRLILPKAGVPVALLPSTSPANAAWPLERLIEAWRVILRP